MKIRKASYTHITVETDAGEVFRPDLDDMILRLMTPGRVLFPIRITKGTLSVLTSGGNYLVVTDEDPYLTLEGEPYNVADFETLAMGYDDTPTLGHYGPTYKTSEETETTFIILNG